MRLTHFDDNGSAVMVDVGAKDETGRRATAAGSIRMSAECFEAAVAGTSKKGDVLGAARIAGIMAAKKTSELIPLCHQINLTGVTVEFEADREKLEINAICEAKTTGRTGVEMEALTGASVALLTIYDMCKALDRAMEISGIRLLCKCGGKSGNYTVNDFEKAK